MRICIVAEHASYRFGGEAVLPLHYFSRLRQRGIDAWLVVHERTRPELEALFPLDLDRFRFIEDRWYHKLIFRLSSFLPRRVSEATLGLLNHLLTQFLQRKVVRALVAEKDIELIHQPIPVSPRFPSLMAGFGVPVVIGPMNGGMEYPKAFRQTESAFSRISVNLARSFSNLVNSTLPGKKLAKVLLVANQRTRMALPSCARGQIIELPENGVNLKTWSSASQAERGKPDSTRFLFIGRLVDWKAADIAIEALCHVPEAELEIIGDGPMRTVWQQQADQLKLSSRVVFSGWLPQESCAERLHSSVALVLPSIYECGGAVVLEAMAAGIPVIATKWGGPVDYLDSSSGFLLEPDSREGLVRNFAQAMRELIAQPELARQMGNHGRARVEQSFDWEKKVDEMLHIYRRTIAQEKTGSRRQPA